MNPELESAHDTQSRSTRFTPTGRSACTRRPLRMASKFPTPCSMRRTSRSQKGESRRKAEPGQSPRHILDNGSGHDTADGVPCTNISATIFECLCATDFRFGLAIVDSALHNHHRFSTKEQLIEYFAAHGKVSPTGLGRREKHSNARRWAKRERWGIYRPGSHSRARICRTRSFKSKSKTR